MRILVALLFCLILAAPIAAQKHKREPLTESQQDQIAEAGIDPVTRVGLYVKFLDGYADTVKGLTSRAKSSARAQRLNDELLDFAALLDEFGDNLDVYADRKADIRKSFKGLNAGIERWQAALHALSSEPGFDLALKEALASLNDLVDQTKQISTDQEAYFKAHPDEKGQDRWEPK